MSALKGQPLRFIFVFPKRNEKNYSVNKVFLFSDSKSRFLRSLKMKVIQMCKYLSQWCKVRVPSDRAWIDCKYSQCGHVRVQWCGIKIIHCFSHRLSLTMFDSFLLKEVSEFVHRLPFQRELFFTFMSKRICRALFKIIGMFCNDHYKFFSTLWTYCVLYFSIHIVVMS